MVGLPFLPEERGRMFPLFERGIFPNSPKEGRVASCFVHVRGGLLCSPEEGDALVACPRLRGWHFSYSVSARGEPYLFLGEKISSVPPSSKIPHFIRKRGGTSSFLRPVMGGVPHFARKRAEACRWHLTAAWGESGRPLTMQMEMRRPW